MTPDTVSAAPASRRARILAVVCAAVFLSVLNGSIVNVVLPAIGQDLAVEAALLGWVVTAYSLVYAVAVPRLVPPERLASGQSISNMLFFLGGSLGATVTTAMLSARAAAIDGFNPVHDGAGVGFSDAFLLLMLPVAVALVLSSAVPGRLAREPRGTTPASPPTPIAEPSAPS